MSKRARIVSFGGAGLLVVAGSVAAAVIGGGAGQIVAMVLVGVGLVMVVSLIFYEVGLSEDRERAEEARRAAEARPASGPGARPMRSRPRLARSRGERRRLDRGGG